MLSNEHILDLHRKVIIIKDISIKALQPTKQNIAQVIDSLLNSSGTLDQGRVTNAFIFIK